MVDAKGAQIMEETDFEIGLLPHPYNKLTYFDPPLNVLFRDVLSKNNCL